ncbi:hypothetical protein F383_35285 [Gossypium arboreum]|uniref:Uncharacterized protein n=1 Tax=Gossypium arboreum TaxID=29729 RepID=A0A0B0N6F9_GOSAR|nr:hypothetical protein F383_35285 [Gossypium arboreum]
MLSSPPPFSFCRLGSLETRPTANDDGGDRRGMGVTGGAGDGGWCQRKVGRFNNVELMKLR